MPAIKNPKTKEEKNPILEQLDEYRRGLLEFQIERIRTSDLSPEKKAIEKSHLVRQLEALKSGYSR